MRQAMEVENPRRVLAVSLESQQNALSRAIQELTGETPEAASTTLAGTTHDLSLKTSYYTATLPIWLDVIDDAAAWASSFLSDEATEVLAALGAVVLVFTLSEKDKAQTRALVREVGRVLDEGLGGWAWDGVRLAVGFGEGADDEWEEACASAGLEFVQVREGDEGLNEFGEKKGMARVREALEANDWELGGLLGQVLDDDDEEVDEEDDGESLDFGYDRADFEGLRQAILRGGGTGLDEVDEADDASTPVAKTGSQYGGEDECPAGDSAQGARSGDARKVEQAVDDDVDKVESMMRRLQAVRDAGEGMGEAQRKRMAARAVAEVMKGL